MLKPIETNRSITAKITFTFALCTLLAVGATSRAQQDSTPPPTGTSTGTSASGAPGDKVTSSQTGHAGKISRSDEKFVTDAAKGGMMEVHMGKLGVQKAQNDQVKQYAQRLIDDHTKANAELKQLASQKGIALPEESKVAGVDAKETERSKVRDLLGGNSDHKAHADMKRLEGLSGTDFDREFVRMAVNDHEKDVKEFEKAAQKADDADIKAFAQKTAPTLREHLQQAKSLQPQVGGTAGGNQK